MKTNRQKIVIISVITAAILLLAYLVGVAISIWSYGSVDEKRTADCAIILGAGTSGGEVSPVYRERINHGIWLYENGYVDYIIVTGGTGDGETVSDAEAARDYAISVGVPSDIIIVEAKSTITEENIENAKVIMDAYSLEDAIIVSDPLHLKRAMLMCKDYGIRAYSSPTPTSMYRSLKTKLPFLLREEYFYIGYSIARIFR